MSRIAREDAYMQQEADDLTNKVGYSGASCDRHTKRSEVDSKYWTPCYETDQNILALRGMRILNKLREEQNKNASV